MYGYAYRSAIEEGYTRSFEGFNQELNNAITTLNNDGESVAKPAEPTAVKEMPAESPVVWETDFMYDDAPWIETIQNAELVIHYPGDILAPRHDGKGYRFKISNLDIPVVSMGQLTYNNVDPSQATPDSLLIDTSTQAKQTTITLLDPKEQL